MNKIYYSKTNGVDEETNAKNKEIIIAKMEDVDIVEYVPKSEYIPQKIDLCKGMVVATHVFPYVGRGVHSEIMRAVDKAKIPVFALHEGNLIPMINIKIHNTEDWKNKFGVMVFEGDENEKDNKATA